MRCILCLKEFGNKLNLHIRIFSTKGEGLSVRHVIEKYFWIKADEMCADRNLICRFCWKALLSFHKFYVHIETIHKATKHANPKNEVAEVIYCSSIVNYVKEEETVDNTTTMIPEIDTNNHLEMDKYEETREGYMDKDCNTVLDKADANSNEGLVNENFNTFVTHKKDATRKAVESIDLSCVNYKPIIKKRGRPRKVRNTIKEAVATKHTADDSNSNTINHLQSEKNSECENKKPHKMHPKSIEFDEIIAKNFKLCCCLCQTILSNFSQLKTHFRAVHNTRGYVRCCGKKLLKRGVLVDHIFTHQNPNYFSCTKCNKVMTTRRSLELHTKAHETDRERVYQCNVCLKSYFNHVVYLRHLQLHAPEEEKKFKCSQCTKTFVNKYNMTQHLKLVHLNLYAKVCDICGKSVRGNEAFQRHQQQHEGMKPPLIECNLCGVLLTTKYGLARHMKLRHTEKYTLSQKCSICLKISPNLVAHNCHMKYVHSMKRKHACTLCDKAFKRPKDLREHMTIHTGEVLYTCTHCPKTFNSNANMYSHRKRVHPKEWEENRQKHIRKTEDNGNIETLIETKLLTSEQLTTDI